MASPQRVVVVGAGITGLSVAWFLRHDHGVDDVAVLEASSRSGGIVHTVDFAGSRVDVGPDAFLARQPEAQGLARRVGLGDGLVAPATSRVVLWTRGRLRPLPRGTVMGVPSAPVALARSRVLSLAGLARAVAEPLRPRPPSRAQPADCSVADVVAERFGAEVVDRLVEPLLGGVYAGTADRLSLAATMPPVAAAAATGGSLTAALRRREVADTRAPVFLTVKGGLTRLVDALADDLGARLCRDTAATAVARSDDSGWSVATATGHVRADAVVVTVPARAAASLLATAAPAAAAELAAIRAASVVVVTLAYRHEVAAALPSGSGMLVPRSEGRMVKAATWVSQKWPHQRAGPHALVRASVGRSDDTAALELDDAQLAAAVAAELTAATRVGAPEDTVVTRWPHALPQYEVGHRARLEQIRHDLRSAGPGLHAGGAAFDGVGISACIRQAQQLAQAVAAGR